MDTLKCLDSHLRYTVGWIAPLSIERAAVEALLDTKHGEPRNFSQPPNDTLSYSWGSIGEHNVVIASLKAGLYGITSAATTATSMLSTFPGIRFGLLVGIGGGIPRAVGPDIRLGDVVVSQPSGSTGGVIQYDLVKLKQGGERERKDFLSSPPEVLLYALSNLQSQWEQGPSKMPVILAELESRNPYMFQSRPNNPGFGHQGSENDRLFNASYDHVPWNDCAKCLKEEEVERSPRCSTEPSVHFGIIASGNSLVKDAATREELLEHIPDECICYEMEAAGLMNSFPCLVIRGISDYSDSHKNYRWQRYAAATAAAFGKELLGVIRGSAVEVVDTAVDVIKNFADQFRELKCLTEDLNEDSIENRLRSWLCPPNQSINHARAVEKRYGNTCSWFLGSTQYIEWKTKPDAFLWVHGMAGCGKTVLSSAIIEQLREEFAEDTTTAILYFYFDFNDKEKQNLEGMVYSLVHQMRHSNEDVRRILHEALDSSKGERPSLGILSDALKQKSSCAENIYIVLDGLDEVDKIERRKTCSWIKDMVQLCKNNLRVLATSRSEQDIEAELSSVGMTHHVLPQETQVDIQAFVEHAVKTDHRLRRWFSRPDVQQRISEALTEPGGMFQWVTCQLDRLGDCIDPQALQTALTSIPESLEDLYSQILDKIPKPQRESAMRLFQILAYSNRPLTADEAVDALATDVSARPAFEPVKRLPDPREVTRYCSSLIFADTVEFYDLVLIPEDLKAKSDLFGQVHTELITSRALQLAHKSVRDYITSNHAETTVQQYLNEPSAKSSIVQLSLCYLMSLPHNLPVWEISRRYPFALWASRHWWEYAVDSEQDEPTSAVIAEFLGNTAAYGIWWSLYTPETSRELASEVAHMDYLKRRKMHSGLGKARMIVPALLTATSKGWTLSIEKLLATNRTGLEYRKIRKSSPYDSSCPPGHYERLSNRKFATPTALYKAAELGDFQTVQILLKYGARAHMIGGLYGSPFTIACRNGNEEIASLLLDQTGELPGLSLKLALLQTASQRHECILQLFVARIRTPLLHILDFSILIDEAYSEGIEVPSQPIPAEDLYWLIARALGRYSNVSEAEIPYSEVGLLVEGFKVALRLNHHAQIREMVQLLEQCSYKAEVTDLIVGLRQTFPTVEVAFKAGSADALAFIYKLNKPGQYSSIQPPSIESCSSSPTVGNIDAMLLIASCYRPSESGLESGSWEFPESIMKLRCLRSKKTALHLAAEHGNHLMVKALVDTFAPTSPEYLQMRDVDENMALHLAAANGHFVSAVILQLNANEASPNFFGFSAVDVASANGHRDLAKCLASIPSHFDKGSHYRISWGRAKEKESDIGMRSEREVYRGETYVLLCD